ncbi:MAG: hypothetical protein KKF57_10730 [Firmicutes bacterium]|nr:hypothetical protein [Bacillota bacterium]
MNKLTKIFVLFLSLLIATGCTNQEVKIPDTAPVFIQKSDFQTIDWQKKAVEFGEYGVVGNENKSGVIGADMPSLDRQKWMWHLWDVPPNEELTIVGFHKETQKVFPILFEDSWSLILSGPNNGADSHSPSSVKIPEKGEWAILLYIDDEFFDTLIYEIYE